MSQAVVIGGGLAGAALAARLAQAGREVLLLERETSVGHKVCGEFLSYESHDDLARVGVDLEALGAERIDTVALASGRTRAEAKLPFSAFSLSRKVLDQALLERAAALGVKVRQGVRVTSLTRQGEAWRLQTDAGESIDSRDVFLATGKHDLKAWKRPPGLQPDLIGFKLHWRLNTAQTTALCGRVELHLFPGGYAGLELVEDGVANLCLLVQSSAFARLGRSWDALLAHLLIRCPALAERLTNGTPCFPRPLAISAIPYGHVQRESDGVWRLGDQAAVIPSFAGDGMSIALHSAHLAADLFLAEKTPDQFQRQMARDVRSQVLRATRVSRLLVQAWAQPTLAAAVRFRPDLLTSLARTTRIPPAAMARTAG